MQVKFIIPAIKCSGCISTIEHHLKSEDSIKQIDSSLPEKSVSLIIQDANAIEPIQNKLASIGFPAQETFTNQK